jgi:hypothetical protein
MEQCIGLTWSKVLSENIVILIKLLERYLLTSISYKVCTSC